MTLQTVWDLHFVDDGIPEIRCHGWSAGIVYHIFDSRDSALAFASQWERRRAVILFRPWAADYLVSPFVTDHREARNG